MVTFVENVSDVFVRRKKRSRGATETVSKWAGKGLNFREKILPFLSGSTFESCQVAVNFGRKVKVFAAEN